MQKTAGLWIAGHTGMVGSALLRKFSGEGYENLILWTHAELELCDASAVERFGRETRPEYVILAAAKVGGIAANRDHMNAGEFLNVDDFADIAYELFRTHEDPEILNVGSSVELPVRELAETVAECAGYRGAIHWDPAKPDGIPRKLLDSSRLHAISSWRPRIALKEGIRSMVEAYRAGRVVR